MLDLENAARDNLRLSPAELPLVKLFYRCGGSSIESSSELSR